MLFNDHPIILQWRLQSIGWRACAVRIANVCYNNISYLTKHDRQARVTPKIQADLTMETLINTSEAKLRIIE